MHGAVVKFCLKDNAAHVACAEFSGDRGDLDDPKLFPDEKISDPGSK